MTIAEQRRSALERANESRSSFCQLKAHMKNLSTPEAFRHAAEIVRGSNGYGSVRIYDLLDSVPRLHSAKIEFMLTQWRVWPLRPLNKLTDKQRIIVSAELIALSQRAMDRSS